MAPNHPFTLLATLALLLTLVSAVAPAVDLSYSKYKGKDVGNGVTQWLGMRYAAPPVGALRFMPPQDPSRSRKVKDASKFKYKCLSSGVSARLIGKTQSEDCLFINVFAPTNATRKAKLPVYIFIQGGGFNSNAHPSMDGTELIQASGMNMIVVTLNYRVSIFGFLSHGDKLQPNNGLLDQRKALQWVQKYISRFGGNPNHVVLGGSSSGGASVAFHLTAYGGRDDKLFHAAAAESISSSPIVTLEQAAYRAQGVMFQLGCTEGDAMACMRNKTSFELSAARKTFPAPGGTNAPLSMWMPVVDGDLVRNALWDSFSKGNFVKVPTIIGATTNEGIGFAPATSSQAQSDSFWQAEYPMMNSSHTANISALYSDETTKCSTPTCFSQQLKDSYGDMRFMCSGVSFTSAMSYWMPKKTWNYWYNVQNSPGGGVTHGAQVNAIWGTGRGSLPNSYLAGGVNANITAVMQGYWASFIRSYDPNKYRYANTSVWQAYSKTQRQRLVVDTGARTSLQNMTQTMQNRCDYFDSIASLAQQ
ncbi:Alpha/Beta hydrolase protein [Fusarium flagelliforme]|uniref:Carboxylic ester hydrolase n=1 Tax=Fusarium flagelliforme TaxID=2675880 RepID=A0A395MFB7_9HYPO|nr:Alpha/Beta hydrolase protein [Fusarium flagelliforme]KAH7193209.1 Alpha/Beta hydrolase protein [Fusarium flagelliforme]RFN46535.1 hypothetical protein FIE12Z_9210 [Fusarium flagelliforme]